MKGNEAVPRPVDVNPPSERRVSVGVRKHLPMDFMNGHRLKCRIGRCVINRNDRLSHVVEYEIRRSNAKSEGVVSGFWCHPFDYEIDVQNKLTAAPVRAFRDSNCVHGVVVPSVAPKVV